MSLWDGNTELQWSRNEQKLVQLLTDVNETHIESFK